MLFCDNSLAGYLFGVFSRSRAFNAIQRRVKINRMPGDEVWNGIFAMKAWVRVFDKEGKLSYLGQISNMSANTPDPILILTNYQLVDIDGRVIVDNSQNSDEQIMVRTKDSWSIEITRIK